MLSKILFFLTCLSGTIILIGSNNSTANAQNPVSAPNCAQTDPAAFFAQIRTAFEKRDGKLLLPLLDDYLYSGDYQEGARCTSEDYCPREVVIDTYFGNAQAVGWTKFDAAFRMGFSECTEDAYFLAPCFPYPDAIEMESHAYIYAENVNIRELPYPKSKIIAQRSGTSVSVDINEACETSDYGGIVPEWLPVIVDEKKGYVATKFTNWWDGHGNIKFKLNEQGALCIVAITWGDTPWYAWGCESCEAFQNEGK